MRRKIPAAPVVVSLSLTVAVPVLSGDIEIRTTVHVVFSAPHSKRGTAPAQ